MPLKPGEIWIQIPLFVWIRIQIFTNFNGKLWVLVFGQLILKNFDLDPNPTFGLDSGPPKRSESIAQEYIVGKHYSSYAKKNLENTLLLNILVPAFLATETKY